VKWAVLHILYSYKKNVKNSKICGRSTYFCIYLHIIAYFEYICIFDKFCFCREAFGDSEDDERSDAEPQSLPSPGNSPPPEDLLQSPVVPSQAADMCKAMLQAGGPNYQKVLQDADIHMGTHSENIPSERCGGEARRAILKRKARYITRSAAETFAYCTSNTVANEDAADILQTFTNVRINCLPLFSVIVSYILHAVSDTAYAMI
jgi:hypothetical protein